MTDIAAFLTARLDEDEATAQPAADRASGRWFVGEKWNVYQAEDISPQEDFETHELVVYGNMKSQSEHIARHNPARVLAEVAAKRAIIALLPEPEPSDVEGVGFSGGWDRAIRAVLEALALSYADHPDYKESWRP